MSCSNTHPLQLNVVGHQSQRSFLTADIQFDAILGLDWLQSVNPKIDWRTTELKFINEVHQLTAIKDEQPKSHPALHSVVKEFEDIFPSALPLELPPERGSAFRIVLKPDTRPVVRPMRRFSPADMESLNEEISSLSKAGFIKPSDSEFGAQVLFVDKKDGSRRMVIDYRSLNEATVRDAYPLPLIDELFDRLKTAKVFSKLDLRSGYHQMLLDPNDTRKTAFRTPIGSFEFLVLPFGVCNGPSAFVRMIDWIFPATEYGSFLAPYIDDLLIFSDSIEEHEHHCRRVFERMREQKLFAKLSKCEFGVLEAEFLGFIVSAEGLKPDPSKVQAIVDMAAPKDVPQLRSFLGAVTFLQRFIRGFSHFTAPLTNLLKKDTPFDWTKEHQESFNLLKQALSSAPVLRPFDPKLPILVQTDASKTAVGAVLLQDSGMGQRPVAYHSRKLQPAELNYPVQQLEMLAVVDALRKWTHYLRGTHFKLETDHKSLEHVKLSKDSSSRLIHWYDDLALFDFEIVYRPGSTNCMADSLSRLVPTPGQQSLNVVVSPMPDPELVTNIKDGYAGDSYFAPVFQSLVLGQKVDPKSKTRINRFFARDGLIFLPCVTGDRLCIPEGRELRHTLLRECHDATTAGHFGMEKTYQLLSRRFFWPKMGMSTRKFVAACEACQKTKPDHQATAGLLQPLEIPQAPWESVGMDFITALPESDGFDSILTVVDRFSKMAHFIPTKKTVTAPETATLFVQNIYRMHGMPLSIVSDRDPKFTSDFWTTFFERLGTKLRMSTVDHPQSDGQAERANGVIIQLLRTHCYENQKSWASRLPTLEFAYNNAPNASTKQSPFQTVYGQNPRAPVDFVPGTRTLITSGSDLLENIKTAHQFVRDNLITAQDLQANVANRKRREVIFKVGEEVLLDADHALPSTTPSESSKLTPTATGPYTIKAVGLNWVELALPHSMGTHSRVNISKVRHFTRPITPHEEPPAEEDGSYEIERIVKKRIRNKKPQYCVRWKGYDSSHDSWLPLKELDHAQELVEEFENTHH